MQVLPHTYRVGASGEAQGTVTLTANGLADLPSSAPREFGGPGDQWSPESLLCAAVASCFVLTFRAIARTSKFEWRDLQCGVEGTLERVEGVTQFTKFLTNATLTVPAGTNVELSRRLLEKAEHGCLVVNSLRAPSMLQAQIVVEGEFEGTGTGG